MKLNLKKMTKTITLGITPAELLGKNNCQILNINFNRTFNSYVHVTFQYKNSVQTVKISTQQAEQIGFINVNSLKKYCK